MSKGESTPHESPNTLRSAQILTSLDVLSEGEIYGLSTGDAKSIYINDTPVIDKFGQPNLSGVSYQLNKGTADQPPLTNVPSVESEVGVNVDVEYNKPIVRTVTKDNIDRLRITLGVKTLVQYDDNGSSNPTSVQMQIKINNNVYGTANISGKTTSQYLRSYVIENLPPVPFDIEIVRTTPDSTSDKLQNETIWSSFTEINDSKLRYPHTAVIGTTIDSEQFNGNPTRNFLLKGIIVNVPSNYNPETREYDGLWDGSFKKAWTDNPAWIFYDIATNKRYGLGERIGEDGVDKAMLYTVAQYCDGLVENGFGGYEPRMTLNCAIFDQRGAYEVLNDLCSVFRGMPIWDGLQLSVTLDNATDPVWNYTNANVVDGSFKYKGAALKARHTAVEVEYTDKHQSWEKKVEHVQSDDLIRRIGYNVKKVQAFGCTSRGQAHRMARWILETERLESQMVTFAVGREGLNHIAGDVIEIADNRYSGSNNGGRIKEVYDGGSLLDLDRDVVDAEQNSLALINQLGKVERYAITGHPQPYRIALNPPAAGAFKGQVWTMTPDTGAKPRLFRCSAINENDDGTFQISAMEHVPEKNSSIDGGYVFDPSEGTEFGGNVPRVRNVEIDSVTQNEGWSLRATWETETIVSNLKFRVDILTDDDKIVTRQDVEVMEFTYPALDIGSYKLVVRGLTDIGQMGEKVTVAFTIAEPKKPAELKVSVENFAIVVRPVLVGNASGTTCEFYHSPHPISDPLTEAEYLGNGFILSHSGLSPLTDHYYFVRTVNPVGKSEFVHTGKVTTTANPNDINTVIDENFPDFDWVEELTDLPTRSYLAVQANGNEGVIGGVFVDGTDENSVAMNFVANKIGFSHPDDVNTPLLYWDADKQRVTLVGSLHLLDGKTIDSAEDITGLSGAGLYRYESDTFPWADPAIINEWFKSVAKRNPVDEDVFTLYKQDLSYSETRKFLSPNWVTAAFILDGDMIATGTINGNKFVAGTSISAPIIDGGRIIGGDAGFGETDGTQGFPLGDKFYRTVIQEDGTFKAKNGEFEGTVRAGNIIGDLVSARKFSALNSSIGRSGSWRKFNTEPMMVQNNTEGDATVAFTGGSIICYAGATSSFANWNLTVGWRLLRDGVVVDNTTTTANDVGLIALRGTGQGSKIGSTVPLTCPVMIDNIQKNDASMHEYEIQFYYQCSGAESWTTNGKISGSCVGQIFRDGGAWQ